MQKIILLICFGGMPAYLLSQVNADSLYKIWQNNDLADTVRLKAIHNFSIGFLNTNPDSTKVFALQELAYAEKIQNKAWQGKALNLIGAAWRYQGEYARSLQAFEQSIPLLEAGGDRSNLAAVYGNMGDVYRVQSNFNKAIECINKSLNIAEAAGDRKKIADAYVSLATIYYDIPGNFDMMRAYLLKAQSLYDSLGSQAGLALVYGNLSSIYLEQGDNENALLFNKKCIDIQDRLGDLFGLATSLHNRASIYTNLGHYDEALNDFDREITIFKDIGDQEGLADAYNSKGELWLKLKRYPEAIHSCKDALLIAQTIGAFNLREVDACDCLYRAYLKLGNTKKALKYLEQFMTAKDSLELSETAQILRKMELERQTVADSLSREKERFLIEIAHQQTLRMKDRTQGILLIAGLGGALVACAFGIRMLYFRRRSRHMQARSEALEKQQLLNEIDLLKTQVNPHFLFNSLSILSSLVHVNADLSEQFIEQLARSYRYILEQKDQTLVTLRTELEFIHAYAFLLKIRFEDKIALHLTLQEDLLDKYKVAPLTLQLLIENAVKHNRMSVREPLVVEVSLKQDFLIVKNPLRKRSQLEPSTGTGLNNIINRYALLTDKPVWAGESEGNFVVKIPLLY